MVRERFPLVSRPQRSETPYCWEGHENPYAWRNACPDCDKICEQEDSYLKREEEMLAARLRKETLEDPETWKLFLEWCKERERKVTTSRDAIEFESKKAELYRSAGLKEEAKASFDAVETAARNEGAEDLLDQGDQAKKTGSLNKAAQRRRY
jgi:hypothetical protein